MTDLKAAANIAGVGRTTAHRWMKEPLFLEELTRLRDRALSEALSAVKSYTAQAAGELDDVLRRPRLNKYIHEEDRKIGLILNLKV